MASEVMAMERSSKGAIRKGVRGEAGWTNEASAASPSDKHTASDSERDEQERSSFGDDPNYMALPATPLGKRKNKSRAVASPSQHSFKDHGSPPGSTNSGGRHDSSLGALTKKFLDLINSQPTGLLDLNKAATVLNVQKRRIYDITNVLEGVGLLQKQGKNSIQWMGGGAQSEGQQDKDEEQESSEATLLKEDIAQLQEQERLLDAHIEAVSEALRSKAHAEGNKPHLYVTDDDITGLPCFGQDTIFAIRGPPSTILEVMNPDSDTVTQHAVQGSRRYRVQLRSSSGPVDVYLVQHIDSAHPAPQEGLDVKMDPATQQAQDSVPVGLPQPVAPPDFRPGSMSTGSLPVHQPSFASCDTRTPSKLAAAAAAALQQAQLHAQQQPQPQHRQVPPNFNGPPSGLPLWAALSPTDGLLPGASPLPLGLGLGLGMPFPSSAAHNPSMLGGLSPLGMFSPASMLDPDADLMEAWFTTEPGWAASSVEQYYRDDRHTLCDLP